MDSGIRIGSLGLDLDLDLDYGREPRLEREPRVGFRKGQDTSFVRRIVASSRSSRTLRASASEVNGFSRRWMSGSRTPWRESMSSVYPEVKSTGSSGMISRAAAA